MIDFTSSDFLNQKLPTPCYLVDEGLLIQNLELLHSVEERAGCRILLAQKGFSMFSLYPLIGRYLSGVTSSSLWETRLGYEEMGKEVHVYAPAYVPGEFPQLLRYADHIVSIPFPNGSAIVRRWKACPRKVSCGIRINRSTRRLRRISITPALPIAG